MFVCWFSKLVDCGAWPRLQPATGNRKDNQQQHVEPLALFFVHMINFAWSCSCWFPMPVWRRRRGVAGSGAPSGLAVFCIIKCSRQIQQQSRRENKNKSKRGAKTHTHTHEKRVQFVARPLGRQAATAMKYLCRCVCTCLCVCVCVYACVRVRVTDRRTAGGQISNENRVQSAGN